MEIKPIDKEEVYRIAAELRAVYYDYLWNQLAARDARILELEGKLAAREKELDVDADQVLAMSGSHWVDEETKRIIREGKDRITQLEGIIAAHDLCHNLHGKVGAREFADGCAAEQRKIYGCAPDADELANLKLSTGN